MSINDQWFKDCRAIGLQMVPLQSNTRGTMPNSFAADAAFREPSVEKKWINSDEEFDRIFPANIRKLSIRHWTPLSVIRNVASFLGAEKGTKVLDIGSGIGKFCIMGSLQCPEVKFYGVEQRKSLVDQSEKAKRLFKAKNAYFINANFTSLDFGQFDHFYFYNSFYENITNDKIDDSVDYSLELFNQYSAFLFRQLEKRKAGTRLATYHTFENEIPPSYHEVGSDHEEMLKYWVKV